MKYLVDANVLSEATKPHPDPLVLEWLGCHQADLCVNPIILGELQFGILKLPEGQRKKALLDWFDSGVRELMVVDLDRTTASHWATLLAQLRKEGHSMPVKDSLIAATARQHGFCVSTRNVRDFEYAGVRVVNPFLR